MTSGDRQHFLPDFGSLRVAIRMALLAVIIAVLITIGRNEIFDPAAWQDLNLLTGYALVLSLISSLVLKLFSPVIRRMSVRGGSLLVLLLILCTIVISSEVVVFALYDLRLTSERWPEWHSSLLTRSILVGAIVAVLGLRYLQVAHRAEMESRAEQEARLQALQSRIRPHFLFNSMNSIASLTRSDPALAETALQDLADLFRVLLADARKLVPISAEREISRQYLEIEKLRLGDRLKVTWQVSNVPRSALIPALTLQPLLENAIYHGIEPRFQGGTLRIEIWGDGDTLNIMISNPLPDVPKHAHGKGNKIALDNIRMRLKSHYGDAAQMQSLQEGGQYHVKLRMPIVRG
ncbi:MAG: histidine kinase [Gammaproteobacteria bacterium]|nr:histidine kinase [Gammaproteobacteria bacterium]